ncbi:MAG: pirin family protein [Pseudomonadota bacterium]
MTITQTISPRAEQLGPLPIRRLLPAAERQMVGPFIFMDQGGPLTVPYRPDAGVPEHPHAGLSTFTYLMAGSGYHRDSAGNEQIIETGDIALMTAGSGITHEERPNQNDGAATRDVYFLQMWLALPDEKEEMDPVFEHHPAASLPLVALDGGQARILIGEAWGQSAPTTTFVETIFADVKIEPGGQLPIDSACAERAVFLLEGDASIDGKVIKHHHLNILQPANRPILASENGARAILLGGANFLSKRFVAGSFVASSEAKIRQWMRDYRAGDFPSIGS